MMFKYHTHLELHCKSSPPAIKYSSPVGLKEAVSEPCCAVGALTVIRLVLSWSAAALPLCSMAAISEKQNTQLNFSDRKSVV